jgi:hypothetical protein
MMQAIAVKSVQLEISRAGDRLIFKVSSLDANGSEIDHDGYHVAKTPDRSDSALEEAKSLASEWCKRHGLATFTMLDHRVY